MESDVHRKLARQIACDRVAKFFFAFFSTTFGISASAIDTRAYFPIDLGSTWTTRETTVVVGFDPVPPVTRITTAVPGGSIDGSEAVLFSNVVDSEDETERTAPLFTFRRVIGNYE